MTTPGTTQALPELLQSCRSSVKSDLESYERLLLNTQISGGTKEVMDLEAQRLQLLLDAIDTRAVQPDSQTVEPVPKDYADWCQYIAGMIETYLTTPHSASEREDAIAAIIERRLKWLPAAPAAQPVSTSPDVPMNLLAQRINAHFEGCASATFGWQSSDPDGYEKAQTAHYQKCVDLIFKELQDFAASRQPATVGAVKDFHATMTNLLDLADQYANAVSENSDDDAADQHTLEAAEERARSAFADALEAALSTK